MGPACGNGVAAGGAVGCGGAALGDSEVVFSRACGGICGCGAGAGCFGASDFGYVAGGELRVFSGDCGRGVHSYGISGVEMAAERIVSVGDVYVDDTRGGYIGLVCVVAWSGMAERDGDHVCDWFFPDSCEHYAGLAIY